MRHVSDAAWSVTESWPFRTQKTGAEITIPIRPELREAIDACPSGHTTYLVTEFGKPFTGSGFSNWFADRCRLAGVPGRAHGLRKAGATILAENGATAHELMSIYGWANLKEAELYTLKANRANLARSGMAKMKLK
jgi:integrase